MVYVPFVDFQQATNKSAELFFFISGWDLNFQMS